MSINSFINKFLHYLKKKLKQMSLSLNAANLQKWLERYKVTATSIAARISPNRFKGGFGSVLSEVDATDIHPVTSFAATPHDGTVALSWVAAIAGPTETGYLITRSTDITFTFGLHTFTASSGATSATDTGLTPLTQYYYKIIGEKTGDDSIAATLTTTTIAALPASSSLTASAVYDTSMILTWTAASGATGYVLERATSSDFSEGLTTLYTGVRTPYSDSGLTPNTTYYYRVHGTATNYSIITYTDCTQATAAALAEPSVPVASAIGDTDLVLTWPAVSGATGYVLQVSASGGALFTTHTNVYTGSALTYSVTGLTANTTYYYRVYATESGYTTVTYSPTCTTATFPALATPSAPTTASIGTTTLTLNWTAVTNATGYYITQSQTSGGTYSVIGNLGAVGNVTTLAVTGLTALTNYYFKIYATAPHFANSALSSASALATTL